MPDLDLMFIQLWCFYGFFRHLSANWLIHCVYTKWTTFCANLYFLYTFKWYNMCKFALLVHIVYMYKFVLLHICTTCANLYLQQHKVSFVSSLRSICCCLSERRTKWHCILYGPWCWCNSNSKSCRTSPFRANGWLWGRSISRSRRIETVNTEHS